MLAYREGICCACQCVVPIDPSSAPRDEERERGIEDWEINLIYGGAIDFIVVQHDAYGVPCEGSGQIPQVVLPPKVRS